MDNSSCNYRLNNTIYIRRSDVMKRNNDALCEAMGYADAGLFSLELDIKYLDSKDKEEKEKIIKKVKDLRKELEKYWDKYQNQ